MHRTTGRCGSISSRRTPTVRGPTQIEARIDAGADDQRPDHASGTRPAARSSGATSSSIPLQDSLIYLQPIYLQSANSSFPQFQKIVLANSNVVVWGNTLQESIDLLLAGGFGSPGGGTSPPPSPSPGATPAPSGSPGPGTPLPADVQGLVAYANQHFELAQAALRNGDFATYGREMALVQDALRRLDALVGVSPGPEHRPGAERPSGTERQPGALIAERS